MKNIIYILLFLIAGITVVPSNSFACSSKIEKAVNKKSCAKQDENSECLKNCKHVIKDKQDCPGKCGENSCKCPTLSHSSVIAIFSQIDKNIFYFVANQKQATDHKTNLLSGFHFIWSPPNIG